MLVTAYTHPFSQGEIDAHEDSFKSADESGQALLAAGHYASDEVKEKVSWEQELLEEFCLFCVS